MSSRRFFYTNRLIEKNRDIKKKERTYAIFYYLKKIVGANKNWGENTRYAYTQIARLPSQAISNLTTYQRISFYN